MLTLREKNEQSRQENDQLRHHLTGQATETGWPARAARPQLTQFLQALDQLRGVSISSGAIDTIRSRLAECLQQPVGDRCRRHASSRWSTWMKPVYPPATSRGQSRCTSRLVVGGGDIGGDRFTAGPEPLGGGGDGTVGSAFAGTVVSDCFSAYNHLPIEQSQLCWAHLIRDLTAIAQRPGVSGGIGTALLNLQHHLFENWYHWKVGVIDWGQLH